MGSGQGAPQIGGGQGGRAKLPVLLPWNNAPSGIGTQEGKEDKYRGRGSLKGEALTSALSLLGQALGVWTAPQQVGGIWSRAPPSRGSGALCRAPDVSGDPTVSAMGEVLSLPWPRQPFRGTGHRWTSAKDGAGCGTAQQVPTGENAPRSPWFSVSPPHSRT